MGKRNLVIGVVLGAVAGGLVSLLNKDTRYYLKEQTSVFKEQLDFIMSNPTESLEAFQTAITDVAERAASSLDGTLNAVDQVESSITKIKNEEIKKINK